MYVVGASPCCSLSRQRILNSFQTFQCATAALLKTEPFQNGPRIDRNCCAFARFESASSLIELDRRRDAKRLRNGSPSQKMLPKSSEFEVRSPDYPYIDGMQHRIRGTRER